MIKRPFFSVIVPTYNRAEFFKIAIDSVLNQTFTNFELIIIDDGSTDGTKKMLEVEYGVNNDKIKSSTIRYSLNAIRYFYQQNKGPAAARNISFRVLPEEPAPAGI